MLPYGSMTRSTRMFVHLAGFTEGDWVYRLYADVPGLADGVYAASVITERVRPLDFVLN